jgi:cysteinyl-tRNA synthetase
MTLRLYNTLTRRKEEFAPLDPTNVRMYVCGPTVYDYAHIGNARPVIVFDVLFRLLRHLYGAEHVTYVRNITDIDDKINARALERRGDRNVPVLDVLRELTEETQAQYLADVTALGNLPPTHTPRATDHVREMIAMIEALIVGGHAYAAEGHVLFDVGSKPDYGKLSRRPLDEMMAGARVEVAPYKKSPMDFVLWKPSDENTPGWESPWGRGRPGWHIECSAMSARYLGQTFDIHGGGIDLLFPHHENEIAQSECAHHGHPLAKVWMHNGFLQVEGEKMSKSLGNFVTINELLSTEKFGGREWSGETLRLNMLRSHYRQPMDWTLRGLEESDRLMTRWFTMADEIYSAATSSGRKPKLDAGFIAALSDDLNTPQALTELSRLENSFDDAFSPEAEKFFWSLYFFGLIPWVDDERKRDRTRIKNPVALMYADKSATQQDVSRLEKGGVDFSDVNFQIEARLAARKAKNFAEADRIRDELAAQGILLQDSASGTTWEVKR